MGDLVSAGEALTGEAPFWEGTSTCSPLTLGRLGLFVASLFACLASRLGEGDLSRIRDSSRDRDPSTWRVPVLGGEVCFNFFVLLLFFLEDSAEEEVSVDSISSWSGSARHPPLPSVKL